MMPFLVVTFGVSWTAFFIAGQLASNGTTSVVTELLFVPGAVAPAFVAVWATHREAGRAGVRALLARTVQWNVGGRWYVFAIGYIIAVRLLAAAIHRLNSGDWPAFADNAFVLPFAIALSTPVQAGEEIGWRGFALPRLTRWLGIRWASVSLGLIWALWHLPLFFIPAARQQASFVVYTLFVIAISVAMAWLWAHTNGSLFLTMVMHSTVNQTTALVSTAAIAVGRWSLEAAPVTALTVIILWVAAVYFLIWMPRAPQFDSWRAPD